MFRPNFIEKFREHANYITLTPISDIGRQDFIIDREEKIGFIACFDLIAYDLKEKKLIWVKEGFLPCRTDIVLDTSTKRLSLTAGDPDCPPSPWMNWVIDYRGNLFKFVNHTIEKFNGITNKLKDPKLRERQKVICSWLEPKGSLGEDQLLDLEVRENEIRNQIDEIFDRTKSSYDDWTAFEDPLTKRYYNFLETYLPQTFYDEILNQFQNQGYFSISNIATRAKFTLKEIIGKESYSRIEDETKRVFGKSLHGCLNTIVTDFLMREANKAENINFKSKKCNFCHKTFYCEVIKDNLKNFIPKHMNESEIEFCQSCLKSAFHGIYKRSRNLEEMKEDLRIFANALGYIPSQNYSMNTKLTYDMTKEKFNEVVPILIEILPYSKMEIGGASNDLTGCLWILDNTYKSMFGSWFEALISANLLEDDTRKLSRGTQCKANDGHICFSIAEKNIDDWLFEHKIEHIKEPKYPIDEDLNPNERFRADWEANGSLIEFFGLEGMESYNAKMELKRLLCQKYKLDLIEITSKDMNKLGTKLKKLHT